MPPILVVCPPPIHSPQGVLAEKFSGAEQRCAGLADAYRKASSEIDCQFFDAANVTTSSRVDGIHLDADQHMALGLALAEVVAALL
jgi:lysophospholipase L1-like esterase